MKTSNKQLEAELNDLRASMASAVDAKSYRILLARLGGLSGRGPKKRAAALKANRARWSKARRIKK